MVLDIRTLSINKNENIRKQTNIQIKKTSDIYDFTTIISEGTRNEISLNKEYSAIIPLGADIISTSEKKFDKIKFLYIGTLSGREIEKTIIGFSIFLKNNPDVDIHYDIVGDGFGNELQNLKDSAKELGIDNHITFHGYKQHNENANKHKFNSEEIRNTLKDSQWEIIVEKTLQKVLDNMTTK